MTLLEVAVKALDDLKAQNIRILDMRGISPLFDYMVISTASNNRQAEAMMKRIKDDAFLNGFDIKGVEGNDGSWILVDCKDIIINIFNDESREHYGLDKLYLDVKTVDVNEILRNANK